ncbi:HNH endonuclease signature motif containing protein [Ornithinimicrobium cerasi]|uniref:HNH endonuclease signature motif containing protein n=1 Tax=Ornithinimicrobium cerasi TaxID=2248773 RepID=UPI000EFF6610|nr:HNH endonuclease signature motif containing protein [Ornithinimicrobium cerasi]
MAQRSTWLDRLNAKTRIDPPPAHAPRLGECWTYTGSSVPGGYGTFWKDEAKGYVHRIAYTEFVGPIPAGLTIDHLCRNRACWRPTHLEAVTQRVNNLRAPTSRATLKAAQTECVNGHEFDAANTYVAPNGTRKCRACRAATKARAYARKTGKAA